MSLLNKKYQNYSIPITGLTCIGVKFYLEISIEEKLWSGIKTEATGLDRDYH